MKEKQFEYQEISHKTSALLNQQENTNVDFKRSLNGLDATDLIAFANSEFGGTILVGIDESEFGNGKQKGIIVGCPIDDGERLRILNKAEECIPPVEIDIIIENLADKPFFRIEIPSGADKPYCTKKGTYMVRGDGRNVALFPDRLLNLFLMTEGDRFLKRFQESTQGIEDHLNQIKYRLQTEFDQIYKTVHSMDKLVEESLGHISGSAASAKTLSDEAASHSSEALEQILDSSNRISKIENLLNIISKRLDNFIPEDQNTPDE